MNKGFSVVIIGAPAQDDADCFSKRWRAHQVMTKTFFRTVVFLVFAPAILADGGGEREALARLVHEIDALMPVVREAKMHADPTTRIHFQYGWLKHDLERIKFGIREHLNAPRAEPRSFPPLKGDYRR